MNQLAVNIGSSFLNNTDGNLYRAENVTKYVSAILSGAISIAGIILLFLLMGGGIGMISGAGKNDPKAVETGKKTATSALIGFIVVFSTYWIVKLIESITGLNLL